MKRITAPLILSALTFCGIANAEGIRTPDEVVAHMVEGVDHVDNAYVQERMKANPDLLLLDVRTVPEFKAGRIEGATNVPRGVVEFRMADGNYSSDQEIIVTCSMGYRAADVTKTLEEMGYTNVRAHRGTRSWQEAELPFDPPPAEDDE